MQLQSIESVSGRSQLLTLAGPSHLYNMRRQHKECAQLSDVLSIAFPKQVQAPSA